MIDYKTKLHIRNNHKSHNVTDVSVIVKNLALINYLVDTEKITPFLDSDFIVPITFEVGGKQKSVISVAPLLNYKLAIPKLVPFVKLSYPEVNFRLYVKEKKSKEEGVFFLKMISEAKVDFITRQLFRMPWYSGSFNVNCSYSYRQSRYRSFKYEINTPEDFLDISIRDTGKSINEFTPFDSLEHMKLVITHPEHAFSSLKHSLNYVVANHKEMQITKGEPISIYSRFLEENNLVDKEEQLNPHSIFICKSVPYKVLIPPIYLS